MTACLYMKTKMQLGANSLQKQECTSETGYMNTVKYYPMQLQEWSQACTPNCMHVVVNKLMQANAMNNVLRLQLHITQTVYLYANNSRQKSKCTLTQLGFV